MSTRKARQAATLLESGLRQLQQGQLEQARQSCKRALELAPRHPDALHLLGIIALQRGDHSGAVEMIRQAVAIRPDHPAYQGNLAYGYVGLQRLPEALTAFERAARLQPGDPELQLGIGSCLGMMGRAEEAEAALRRLVQGHPRYALGWFNLAKALDEQTRYEEACGLYRHAIQLEPQFADAHGNLGVALHRLERYEEAEESLRACLARNPGSIAAHVNLAIVLNALRRHEEAEAHCREAIRRDPTQPGARAMLAKSLSGQGKWREALKAFEDAIENGPVTPEVFGYLGDALARNGRIPEALEAFDRAVLHGTRDSDIRFVPFARAIALFSAGRIHEAAAAYLGRDNRSAFAIAHPDRRLLETLPQDMHGQEVCLFGEQGIGDELFFLRYAPMLKAHGCRVIFQGNRKIVSILERCAALDRSLASTEPLVAADHTVLVGDLPHLFGASGLDASALQPRGTELGAPLAAASIRTPPWHCRVFWPDLPLPLPLQPLAERLASVRDCLYRLGPAPYIGLTWRAGTDPQGQRGRVWQLYKEIPLEQLAAALRCVGGTLISLQRKPHAGETEKLAALTGRPVHDLTEANDDLEEMLALLAVLDDYVGVSNTNMHLRAGAGRAARVLVPWPAEWRWMIRGDESPWFPGFSIYRQKRDGNWNEALGRLQADLLAALGSS